MWIFKKYISRRSFKSIIFVNLRKETKIDIRRKNSRMNFYPLLNIEILNLHNLNCNIYVNLIANANSKPMDLMGKIFDKMKRPKNFRRKLSKLQAHSHRCHIKPLSLLPSSASAAGFCLRKTNYIAKNNNKYSNK